MGFSLEELLVTLSFIHFPSANLLIGVSALTMPYSQEVPIDWSNSTATTTGANSYKQPPEQPASNGYSGAPNNDFHNDGHGYALKHAPTLPDVEHHEHVPNGGNGHGESFTNTSSRLQSTRGLLGLHPQAPVDEGHDQLPHSDLWWSKVRLALREPFAEFFGVFIMVLFGDGSVAQVLLSAGEKSAPGGNGFGNYQSINWGWGLGVMLGIYVAGDSGAYLNPAITFTNCLLRKLPWRRFPMYLLAQFLGGFIAAGVIYGNYINAINEFEGGSGIRTVPPNPTATAAVFCTYPQPFLTKASQFFSEFIASTILMFVIFALKDDSNNGLSCGSGNWFPLALFFLIFGLGACFGWQTGLVNYDATCLERKAYRTQLCNQSGSRLWSQTIQLCRRLQRSMECRRLLLLGMLDLCSMLEQC